MGGGGGGSSFTQRPDTLRSNDTFEGLLGLCVGPIKGPINGLKSVRVNGTPIEDEDGTLNFPGFTALFADGDPLKFPQTVSLKLGAGASPVNVGAELNNLNGPGTPGPWVSRTLNNTGATAVDLRFIVQQLYRQDKKGIFEHSLNLEIQMKPAGTSTWINPLANNSGSSYPPYDPDGYAVEPPGYIGGATIREYLPQATYTAVTGSYNGLLPIRGKTTSPVVHELRVQVPNTGPYANVEWDIRARLIEPESVDADPNFEKRIVSWESMAAIYNGVIGDHEDWRGLAWLQVYGKATDNFNNLPELDGFYDLKIVQVPPADVFDPETRVYSGVTWDGSWEKAFCRDPAWVISDAISDSISGIAAFVPGASLNKWDALELSKWASEQVPDGKGGTHPRYSMDLLVDQPQKADELIRYMAGGVGAVAWDDGNGQWRLKVDKPEAAVALFTLENIEGEFIYSHTDVDTRFNDVTVVFANEEFDYREDRVRARDFADIELNGHKPTRIVAVGCTNRQQALRMAVLRLRTNLNEKRLVTFSTNRQGRLIERFNHILVADNSLNITTRTTGRVVSSSGTTIAVRDPLRVEVGVTYQVHFTVPNPDYDPEPTGAPTAETWDQPTVTLTRTLTVGSPRGDVTQLQLDAALPADVADFVPIALEAVGLPTLPKKYRVVDVNYEDDGERVSIAAMEIDTGKWDAADGATEEEFNLELPPSQAPMPLAHDDGMFQLDTFVTDFKTKRVLVVRWERPPSRYTTGFIYRHRFNGGPWSADRLTTDTRLELQEPEPGVYEFEIRANDRRDRISAPLTGEYEVPDKPPVSTGGFIQPGTPGADESLPGTYWIKPDEGYRTYQRVAGSGFLSIGGNRVTIAGNAIELAWTPAPDQRLRDAFIIASDALENANQAIDALDDLDDDGILTIDEKIRILIPKAAQLEEAWFNLDTLAGALGITTERTAAAAARTAWLSLLASITPAWNDYSVPSPIVRADYDDVLRAYGEALDTLRLKIARTSVIVEWSPNGTTSWGPFAPGDRYMRVSTDGGLTFGDAMLALGEDGAPGADGRIKQHVFKRAATLPATPSGDDIPSGWSDGPPAEDGLPLWMSVAEQQADGTLVGSWSTPIRLDGADGADGVDGADGADGLPGLPGADGVSYYTWIAYADDPTGTDDFTTGANTGQAFIGIANNKTTATESTNPADYTWSLIRGADGEPGTDGVPGTPGADGQTTYTWFAYADSADGVTNFTTGAPGSRTYLGIAPNKLTATEGTNPADYAWSLIRGADGVDGADGADGLPGAPGADGITYYTWIAYANNSTGTSGFTTGANTGQTYIGIANNKTTATEGTDPADYTWSLIRGADGAPGTDGVPGTPGADGVTTYTWFAYADSSDGVTNFTTGAPGSRAYLGIAPNKTTATESTNPADYAWSLIRGADGVDGVDGADGLPGAPGADGVTYYTWIAYANNSTGTSGFTTGANTGQTHIGIANNKTTATEGTDPADYTWSLIRGSDGVPGSPGADGVTTYTWFAYADSSDGSTNFTTGAPGSRTYLGIAPNKTTATESTNPADYTWSLIKGADGSDGAPGVKVQFVFKRSATQPATPTGNGIPSGWAFPAPAADGNPLWMSEASQEADGTLIGSWATPTKVDGLDGAQAWTPVLSAGVTRVGATFSSQSAGEAFHSLEKWTGAKISWRFGQTNKRIFMGLSDNPAADAGYTSLDFSVYGYDDGTVLWWIDGSTYGSLGTYTASDVWQIEHVKTSVLIRKNGTVVHEFTGVSATAAFAIDSAWYDGNGSVNDVTFVGAKAGEDGVDGTDALTISATPALIGVPCTANGTPKSTVPGSQIKVFQGTADVTSVATYGAITSSGVATPAVSGSGAVTHAGLTADNAFVEVPISHNGASGKIRIEWTKQRDGASGQVGQTDTTISSPGTSYGEVARVTYTAGPNGTFSAAWSVYATVNTSNASIDGYLEFSLDGSSWSAVSGSSGSAGSLPPGEVLAAESAGSISFLGSTFSLSSNQVVYIRLMLRRQGSGTLSSVHGSLTSNWGA